MVVATQPPGPAHGDKSPGTHPITSGVGGLNLTGTPDEPPKTPPRSRGYDNQPGSCGNVLSTKVALALSPSENPPPRSGFPYVIPLKELCLESVASKFEQDQSCLRPGALPETLRRRIVDLLDVRLDLHVAGAWIDDEAYWCRRAKFRWPTFITKPGSTAIDHGRSWKQMYFEKDFEEAVVGDGNDGDQHSENKYLEKLAWVGNKWIRNVKLIGLRSDQHVPSLRFNSTLFTPLAGRLTRLTLEYGARSGLGVGYEPGKFGMSLPDCEDLAKCLPHADTLLTLKLANNFLDCKKVRVVCQGLGGNVSITHLDLAKNHIGCRGTRAVAKLLDSKSVLESLDLSDNEISTDGAFAIAKAIKKNKTMKEMNLGLNYEIGDEGGEGLCNAVRYASVGGTTRLELLDLSACGLGPRTARAAARMIKCENSILRVLSFAGNDDFGPEAGGAFRAAFLTVTVDEDLTLATGETSGLKPRPSLLNSAISSKKTKPPVLPSVLSLEIRGCGFGDECEGALFESVKANEERITRANMNEFPDRVSGVVVNKTFFENLRETSYHE